MANDHNSNFLSKKVCLPHIRPQFVDISFSSGGFAQTDAGGWHSMAIMPLVWCGFSRKNQRVDIVAGEAVAIVIVL